MHFFSIICFLKLIKKHQKDIFLNFLMVLNQKPLVGVIRFNLASIFLIINYFLTVFNLPKFANLTIEKF